jgi:hypothetical protein
MSWRSTNDSIVDEWDDFMTSKFPGIKLSDIRKKLGTTGEFPDGKTSEDDKGELAMAIGNKDGLVFIDFGNKPIDWISFKPEEAVQLAYLLLSHAKTASKKAPK